jgi:hypothetical protein
LSLAIFLRLPAAAVAVQATTVSLLCYWPSLLLPHLLVVFGADEPLKTKYCPTDILWNFMMPELKLGVDRGISLCDA